MLKIILIINIIIVKINIYFKFFRKTKNLFSKNVDKVTINFVKNSYKNISNLLISKYLVNNIKISPFLHNFFINVFCQFSYQKYKKVY